MYLICVSPEEYTITGGDTIFRATTMQQVEQRTKQLAAKFPGSIVYVYQLRKKTVVEMTFDMKSYVYNDKGEVLPE